MVNITVFKTYSLQFSHVLISIQAAISMLTALDKNTNTKLAFIILMFMYTLSVIDRINEINQ